MKQVHVSARIISVPNTCCCCAKNPGQAKYEASSSRTTGVRVRRTQTRSWSFQICNPCLQWLAVVKRRSFYCSSFFISLIVLLFSVINAATGWILTSIISAIIFLMHWKKYIRKSQLEMPNADCKSPPIQYLGWQGSIHSFIISHPEFAEKFESANQKKLVG